MVLLLSWMWNQDKTQLQTINYDWLSVLRKRSRPSPGGLASLLTRPLRSKCFLFLLDWHHYLGVENRDITNDFRLFCVYFYGWSRYFVSLLVDPFPEFGMVFLNSFPGALWEIAATFMTWSRLVFIPFSSFALPLKVIAISDLHFSDEVFSGSSWYIPIG